MYKDRLNYKLLNVLILAVIVYLGLITMDYWGGLIRTIYNLLLPFVISFGIAYALYPLVRKLEEAGVRKSLAVTLVTGVIFVLIISLLVVTIPLVYEQLMTLTKMVSEVVADISTRFEVNMGDFNTSITGLLNNITTSLGKYVSDGTVHLVNNSFSFISKFIIISIVSIYFLAGMDKIRLEVKIFLSKKNIKMFNYLKSVDHELGQYLQGLTIFMLIQLVEYSVLFAIVGHPNWLLLGILASITTVIPYFGGLITNIIAVILASVVSTPVFIATLVICLIFPNVDGYVISPRVYGKTNNINPLWAIFAVSIGGSLAGVLGILIALPLYIVIKCTYHFFRDDIKDRIDDIKTPKGRRRKKKEI